MTPEEAIKYNEGLKRGIDKDEMPEHHKAVQLGIEALKNYIEMKQTGEIAKTFMLPGETEE